MPTSPCHGWSVLHDPVPRGLWFARGGREGADENLKGAEAEVRAGALFENPKENEACPDDELSKLQKLGKETNTVHPDQWTRARLLDEDQNR